MTTPSPAAVKTAAKLLEDWYHSTNPESPIQSLVADIANAFADRGATGLVAIVATIIDEREELRTALAALDGRTDDC